MDYKEHTEKCLITEIVLPNNTELNYHAFSYCFKQFTAFGEMLDVLKRHSFYGSAFDTKRWNEEAGKIRLPVAEKTAEKTFKTNVNVRMLHGLVGMCTELAELVLKFNEAMLKDEFEQADFDNFAEESGDFLYYFNIFCHAAELDEGDIREANFRKLFVRYGEKFSRAAAELRDLDAEKQAMDSILKAPNQEHIPEGLRLRRDFGICDPRVLTRAALERAYIKQVDSGLNEKQPWKKLEYIRCNTTTTPSNLLDNGFVRVECIFSDDTQGAKHDESFICTVDGLLITQTALEEVLEHI